MSLSSEERNTIVALELKKAREAYEDIGILIAANRLNGAANRMYYAVFHAVCALLINDGHHVNTHKGSHAIFSQHYIKTGILPREYGQLYNQLQTMREESDYNCAYDVEMDELQQRLEPAKRLIEDIENIVNG
ncbi:MAG: HEPN domain-containing protein [Paludibacteraceae bacterium]|nr:HEPN domain-containing protein [Paludibacteraceae bacterium]